MISRWPGYTVYTPTNTRLRNCSSSDLHHLTLDYCVDDSASLFFLEIAFVSLPGCSRMYTNHCPIQCINYKPLSFLPTLWDERVWMWGSHSLLPSLWSWGPTFHAARSPASVRAAPFPGDVSPPSSKTYLVTKAWLRLSRFHQLLFELSNPYLYPPFQAEYVFFSGVYVL